MNDLMMGWASILSWLICGTEREASHKRITGGDTFSQAAEFWLEELLGQEVQKLFLLRSSFLPFAQSDPLYSDPESISGYVYMAV